MAEGLYKHFVVLGGQLAEHKRLKVFLPYSTLFNTTQTGLTSPESTFCPV